MLPLFGIIVIILVTAYKADSSKDSTLEGKLQEINKGRKRLKSTRRVDTIGPQSAQLLGWTLYVY